MTEVAPSPMTAWPAQPVAFGGIDRTPRGTPKNSGPDFAGIQDSAEFGELRQRFRGFVFPMSALFFVWYLSYVLLAAYARGFMAVPVVGSINVGLVLGLLQFVSTIVITLCYLRYARRRIDPQVRLIRSNAGVADR